MFKKQRAASAFSVADGQLRTIAATLDAFARGNRAGLGAKERLELVRLGQWVAERTRALAAVLAAEADAEDASMAATGTPLTSWLALTQRLDGREAAGIVLTGRDLTQHARVRRAALAGEIGVRQGRAIVRTLKTLPADLDDRQHLEAARLLLERAETASAGVLAKAGPEVLAQVAPEFAAADPVAAAELRRKRAWTRRSLRFSPDGDGAVHLTASLPELEAAKLKKLVAAYRESDKRRGRDHRDKLAEDRTPEQRNADALIALLADHSRHRCGPKVAGDRPRIVVTISHDLLREQAEQAGLLEDRTEISAGELRRLCCDADLLPVVLGGDSEILDWGTIHRLVPPGLRRALNWRDQGCTFPGCTAPAEHCEAHHIQPWWAGGPTNLDNLVLLCPHHHGLIEPPRFHTSGAPPDRWSIRLGPDGVPEVIPPRRIDASQQPIRHERFQHVRAG